jgi:hypothetical protein
VRLTLAGIRRAKGTARKQARPSTADLIRQVVTDLDADRPADCRDAALLRGGFALAGPPGPELVALDVDHVEFVHGGMKVLIAKSKTDQAGEDVTVGVPTAASAATCPVASLRRGLAVGGIDDGPIFQVVDAARQRPRTARCRRPQCGADDRASRSGQPGRRPRSQRGVVVACRRSS